VSLRLSALVSISPKEEYAFKGEQCKERHIFHFVEVSLESVCRYFRLGESIKSVISKPGDKDDINALCEEDVVCVCAYESYCADIAESCIICEYKCVEWWM